MRTLRLVKVISWGVKNNCRQSDSHNNQTSWGLVSVPWGLGSGLGRLKWLWELEEVGGWTYLQASPFMCVAGTTVPHSWPKMPMSSSWNQWIGYLRWLKKKKKGSVGVINFRTLKWEEYPWLLRRGQWKVRERNMTVEAGDIVREIRRWYTVSLEVGERDYELRNAGSF